jgi:hypothetical protein
MYKAILVGVACCLLQACTVGLKVQDYKYEDKHFTPFEVKGNVVIKNGQPASNEISVYSASGVTVTSDLKTLTELMVQQSTAQIQQRGLVKGTTESKSIELKILTIKSEAAFYHANSKMLYQVTLGNGDVFSKTVEHSSMDPHQDISGCVADGVIALLADAKVRAYLAS